MNEITPAQQRVLRLVMVGYSEPRIAARLKLSLHIVHTHMKAIFKRFGVHTRSELIAKVHAKS